MTGAQLRRHLLGSRGAWPQVAKSARTTVGSLSRIARGIQHPRPALRARIIDTLERASPLTRCRDRRLSTRLDEAQTIADARDPYWPFTRAARRFAEERGWMSPAGRDREYREVTALYDAWGARDADTGRPTRTDYPLTYYEVYGGKDSAASAGRRFIERRVRQGLVRDVDNPPPSPRLREFLAALPSVQRRAAVASPRHAMLRPCPRETGRRLNLREIDRDAIDAWPPRGPRSVSNARRRRRARRR